MLSWVLTTALSITNAISFVGAWKFLSTAKKTLLPGVFGSISASVITKYLSQFSDKTIDLTLVLSLGIWVMFFQHILTRSISWLSCIYETMELVHLLKYLQRTIHCS